MWLKITTGQTQDSKFRPNGLNVRTNAGKTHMLFGHCFFATYRLPGWVQYLHCDFPVELCGRPSLMGSLIIILVYFPHVSEIMAKYFNLSSVLNIIPLFHVMQLEFFYLTQHM